MYLSKLEVIGFKSFATKTALGFDTGISAIVGPNGCGKTNIVDAIRWVLGEQRYSALRSEKMEDVIFNGTKARKPLGMAEATLVIENTRGILPSDYSQVMIGRRVYRSGESEYLLNKVPCRLKDIQTLFMDTGMGADAYSVIELKMVESILSDKTDERRRLFEEAAGVTKYKHRRKAAFRKLESVQKDLVRVSDIVSEVDKAVRSLERQAKRAGQYNEVKDRLRSMEIDLMERELAQLDSSRAPLEEKLQRLKGERTEIDGTLSRDESRLEDLRGKTTEQERRLAEAQRDVSVQMGHVNRVKQKGLVAAERRKALEGTIGRCENEAFQLNDEIRTLEAAKKELHERLSEYHDDEAQASTELEEARSAFAVLEGKLAEKRAEMQKLSDRTISKVHDIADQQTEQDRRRGRVENLHGRSARAHDEINAYENETVRLDADIDRLKDEDKLLRRRFTEAEVLFYEAENRRNEYKKDAEALHGRENFLREEIGKKTAKMEFLEGLVGTNEGLSDGVKFLVSDARDKGGRLVTVADVAVVEEKLRPSVEASLGEYAGMLIVHTFREASEAIDQLKQVNRGKASFVCLDRVPEILASLILPKQPGVIGWASELIRCPEAYRSVFRFILDRTLIVRDRAAATSLVKQFTGIRCVTLSGEIVTGVGVTRGGSQGKEEGGGIGKEAQLGEIREEVRLLNGQLLELEKARETIRSNHDAIDLKRLQGDVKVVEKEMNAVEVRMAQLEFEKGRGHDLITKNKTEIESLNSERVALLKEIEVGTPLLEAAQEEKGEVERRVGALQLEVELLEKEGNARSNTVNQLRVRLATINGEVQNATNDLQRSDERLNKIRIRLEELGGEIAKSGQEIAETESEVKADEIELESLESELQRLENQKGGIEQDVAATREEIHQIEIRIRDDRRSHDDSLTAIHNLELKIADLKAKGDHLIARAKEEFEIDLELKTYPDDEFVDFAALRDDIQGLRDKIRSLGNINFAAFEEYNSEKERLEFLTAQRTDLLEAEKTLLSTIEEINTTAQRKFLETFTKIRTNFIDIFKSLFDPGDECDLRLEEEVDPLEAGIEIIAKPRGKRPTSIDLLSGGEKTLTATALLFAIYLVKPSPFCILDEVDAPLDDANIDRFTRILRKFSDNTQFIVVTHNKRTMEAANALYGVTMEEEGVSKLVTVRFNKASVAHAQMLSG